MKPTSDAPRQFLRALFAERRARNPAYSGRSFARDLGMSQSLLSLVLNGKRPLTPRQAAQVSGAAGLSREESKRLIESTLGRGESKPIRAHESFARLELDRFKLIAHWYHLPLLDLATTHDFRPDPDWIARRLGIRVAEARDAIDRLLALGLLAREAGGRLRKAKPRISFPSTRSEPAVRAFHGQMIQKARDELSRADAGAFRTREISGMTMTLPKRLLPAARERIRKFQEELAEFATEHAGDEVYQLNLQFFPLTRRIP